MNLPDQEGVWWYEHEPYPVIVLGPAAVVFNRLSAVLPRSYLPVPVDECKHGWWQGPLKKPREHDETRRKEIVALAEESPLCRDGELEIDDDAQISEGDDNGCYIQAWAWFDFEGTKFDKEKEP